MSGYVTNIEEKTLENNKFRQVLFTAPHSQLVLMTLKSGEDIGTEVHNDVDQFFRVESGTGKAVLDGQEHEIKDGSAVVVPAGTEHNIINQGEEPLRLYTIYSPPHHPDGTVHETKEEAMEAEKEEHA
ncbi:cupin domain-containing protein [Candidatus Microgenomates bacterium]|nr:MAG: cupin domain-containing protein [Candidatus Microgenomates bacterium]